MKVVTEGFIILFGILILAYLAQNKTVVYAVLIVLGLKFLRLEKPLLFLEAEGLRWSIIFLTAAILSPFAFDKISLGEIAKQFRDPLGFTALFVGMAATYLARQGVVLMDQSPNVVPALIGGTIIGVTFFRGIPVGPLVSSGVVALIMTIYSLLRQI